MTESTIIYTITDEAPALATYSLLPIVDGVRWGCGRRRRDTRDISLAGRILSQFPDRLTPEQQVPDALTELGEIALTPGANIIKLPNISASIPQLKAAVAELQGQGYDLPALPGRSADRRGARDPSEVQRGARLGREPGASSGQLGPACAQGRQGVREEEPALHGRMVE